MSIEFKHSIGDRVEVKAIAMFGIVDAVAYYAEGAQYRVVYWNDGRRCCEWMYEWEIKSE